MLLIRFIGAFVSFVGFFTACQFAHPSKSLDSKAAVASLELTVPTSDESDTDSLVTKSDIDAVEGSSDQVQQKGSAPATLSVFRILATASGTVFGSAASIVFFVNLFFINIGTNCVEGLVRATFAEALVMLFRLYSVRFSCFSKTILARAVQFSVSFHHLPLLL